MKKIKVYAIICARGGSKGIKNKNIKLFCGKPLISYSIKSAIKNKMIQKVIVSTDSEKIIKISKFYGAYAPFKRPKKLAKDNSKEWLVWKHLINFMRDKNDLPDVIISLPATSPLRKDIDITNCINKFIKNKKSDMLITVTKPHRNPYFNMVKVDEDGFAQLLINPSNSITRRQDAPRIYDITTVAYSSWSKYVLEAKEILNGRVVTCEVDKGRAIDIDTPFDLKLADFLIKESNS